MSQWHGLCGTTDGLRCACFPALWVCTAPPLQRARAVGPSQRAAPRAPPACARRVTHLAVSAPRSVELHKRERVLLHEAVEVVRVELEDLRVRRLLGARRVVARRVRRGLNPCRKQQRGRGDLEHSADVANERTATSTKSVDGDDAVSTDCASARAGMCAAPADVRSVRSDRRRVGRPNARVLLPPG